MNISDIDNRLLAALRWQMLFDCSRMLAPDSGEQWSASRVVNLKVLELSANSLTNALIETLTESSVQFIVTIGTVDLSNRDLSIWTK